MLTTNSIILLNDPAERIHMAPANDASGSWPCLPVHCPSPHTRPTL